MQQVTNEGLVYALLQAVKEKSGSAVTNFFIDQEKLCEWVESNLFYVIQTERGVLFFRRDRNFFHLYYYAISIEALADIISNYLPAEQLVIDLIGKVTQLTVFLEVFWKTGFNVINTLHRYVRINKAESNFFETSEEVSLAKNGDADVIANLFEANFDPLSEQVPSLEEVETLIKQQKILVVRRGGAVKGFLVRSTTGQTSILNNFLVDKEYRGEKIGSKLLKHYIFECRNVKRMMLWVIDKNETAINVYQGHGYSPDGLADVVLKK